MPSIFQNKKKNKIWSSAKADREFSKYIRGRDKKCLRCFSTENLQCSHYYGRSNSATRYLPANSICLCYRCHYGNRITGFEYRKQDLYRDFMIKWLGGEKHLNKLEILANSTKNRKEAIMEFMALLTQ